MAERRKRVNLFDIARAARVSTAQAAAVFRGERGTLSGNAFSAVLAAGRRFEYRPDRFLKNVGGVRTGTIAFAAPIGSRPWGAFIESEVVRGVSGAAVKRGLDLLFVLVPPRGRFPTREHVEKVDGTIVFDHAVDSPSIRPLLDSDHPTVLLNREDEALPYASVDNRLGAATVIGHLLHLGHERIVLVTGERQTSDDRLEGALSALASAGLSPEAVVDARWNRRAAYEGLLKILRVPRRPTAVFAFSDWMALGAVAAAWEVGLRVPRDVSVVGFDDALVSEVEMPPLTTAAQPLDALGAAAVEILDGLLNALPADRAQRRLPPRLVVRATTGPPRGGR